MAIAENYLNSVTVIIKTLFRKYKLYYNYRLLPWTDAALQLNFVNFLTTSSHILSDSNHKYRRKSPFKSNWDDCKTKSFFNFSQTGKRKEFAGRKLVGFSMEQMFDVVNDVDSYKDFLPFCKKSKILSNNGENMKADLIIGFPPVVEKYTSHITYFRPNIILAESRDATLFDHLVTNWKFSPGLSKNPRSCVIGFYVSFEFKSLLHSHLANMFFNELVKQMETAFYVEAVKRYGTASIPPIKLKVLSEPIKRS